MVKRARATENSPQTPHNDADCMSLNTVLLTFFTGTGRGQLWGDWAAADPSIVKSSKRSRDNDLI